MRGYVESGFVDKVRAAGGEVYAITSEPQSLASEAEQTWGLDFPSIGDPHHEILATCADRDWLDVYVQDATLLRESRDWVAHPKGYFQPGVLVVTREGRTLYRWRSTPTRKNLGGAVARPTPNYVWGQIEARLADGKAAELDQDPELDAKPPVWPLFILGLLAHGWFLRPKTFPLARPGDKPSVPFRQIRWRLLGFFAFWLLAFVLLPIGFAFAVLLLWAVVVAPGVLKIHREFQNIDNRSLPVGR